MLRKDNNVSVDPRTTTATLLRSSYVSTGYSVVG